MAVDAACDAELVVTMKLLAAPLVTATLDGAVHVAFSGAPLHVKVTVPLKPLPDGDPLTSVKSPVTSFRVNTAMSVTLPFAASLANRNGCCVYALQGRPVSSTASITRQK